MNARHAALLALLEWEQNDAYLQQAIKRTQKQATLSSEDRALMEELVYGVVRHLTLLDEQIALSSTIRMKKIAVPIRMILRLGMYQLFFLTKIPPSAAVNESVKLSKKYGHTASSGFVNAVLRAAQKRGLCYSESREEAERLSINYSFPLPVSYAWLSSFGEKTENIMMSCNRQAPLFLRAACAQNSEELTPHDTIPLVYRADKITPQIEAMIKSGQLTPQDAGFSLPVLALDPSSGMCVLDACAAPGGKTVHIAQKMNDKGSIEAWDIHEHKLSLIQNAAKRLGLGCLHTQCRDATVFEPSYREKFDRILLDVPCSGWGVIRRRPDIKWREPERFLALADIQYRILSTCSGYLKKDGVLVYSTCTFNEKENHEVTERFLNEHPNFMRKPVELPVPSENGEVMLFPNDFGCDGMYLSVLCRR